MCSVDPDELTEMTRATGLMDISGGDVLCRKCGTGTAEVVLRVRDAYCRECFLAYFVHKFRSTIGKSKQIRHGDKVLVATSGGPSSVAMVHLIRQGLNETSHKQLRFVPAFLYVDESCLSENPSSGHEYIKKVCEEVTALKFDCYVTSIEQIMSAQVKPPVLFTKEWNEEHLLKSQSLEESAKDLLISCKSLSAKEDLAEQLRRDLILQAAEALGYEKVFLGDNATSLSVAILGNVAIGRGSQLPGRVHFKSVHRGIEMYRPMREILQNEIQHYVKIHSLLTVQAPSFQTKGQSITSCTEDFVMGLQKDFPATIPTIFRTGDKLMSSSSEQSRRTTPEPVVGVSSCNEICVLCGSDLDTEQGEASAVHAILVSQDLSKRKVEGGSKDGNETTNIVVSNSPTMNGCCGSNGSAELPENSCACNDRGGSCGSGGRDSKREHVLSQDQLECYLCYGCRIIARELRDIQQLPQKVLGLAAEQERRKVMREQIQDFLL
ncbi:cytoplasmic tRNA 2-thiolation protein 2-like [Penaeus japonicus]|uniref:cytoplasmic tRNA 2-thiolation protein 2-like n=1 Tax=Penaeus japonicus TaxID=27405 RepID=UPI001C715702|nr:cytoplasmic tRNA 2-thiolation protein 2-like [Penaeus japonicus]XP_042866014.1 cytoplasmic tRNA 2-thiolation protein 2-like [Penaeus japonicus]